MDLNLFTHHGKHWGFIRDDYVFKNPHRYIGWINENEVYLKDGNFLGYLTEGKFILRNKNDKSHKLKRIKYHTHIPSVTVQPKPVSQNPNDTSLKANEIDCLENF